VTASMLGGPLAVERYDRVLLVLAPAFIVTQYLAYLACRPLRPKLNAEALKHHKAEDGKLEDAKWAELWKDLSGQVWCAVFQIAFSCVAVYIAGCYVLGEATPERRLGDFEAMLVAGDTEFLQLQEVSGLLGSVFAALMASYLWYWIAGWDRDPVQLFHHTAFIGVTFVLARRCSLAFAGITAMAMEGSSPALACMQIFRQLDGDDNAKLNKVFTLAFVASFFFFRVCLFGYGLLTTLGARFTTPQLFPQYVPAWEIDCVLLLLSSGWGLQLYWATLIYKKLVRMLKPKPKAE